MSDPVRRQGLDDLAGLRAHRGWFVALGVVLIVLGLIANPLLASSVLTLLIAAALLVAGELRIVVAIRERPRQGWLAVGLAPGPR